MGDRSLIEPLDPPARRAAVRMLSRALVGSVFNPRVPVAAQRRWMELLAGVNRIPDGVTATQLALGGVPAELIQASPPASSSDGSGAILYLHGGAYVVEGPRNVRPVTLGLALSTGASVYSLDYRLAPEHPMPAAIDDAVDAYGSLAAQDGRIAIAGDSAGGGLALATAVRARDAGLPKPAALALVCPLLDLTLSGPSMVLNRRSEPVLSRAWLEDCASRYLAGVAPDDPRGSPLLAELADLPPTLIQAGEDDILLSDADRLAERARAAGVEIELERCAGLWHDFQMNAGLLHSADAAIARLGVFLRRALATSGPA